MRVDLRVRDVRFLNADRQHRADGLYGWVSFVLGDTVHIDGVAVRRAADGRWHLSFPRRLDAKGVEHSVVRPLDSIARASIEAQVFAALRRGARIP